MIETEYGLEYKWGSFRIFFGNRYSQLSNLNTAYPQFNFMRVKQVHGNQVVESKTDSPDFAIEADGHISKDLNLALCSISADCVPVLMASPDTGWFGAFHAGWRGVASRIVPLGLQALLKKGANPEKIQVWIGPHILQDSFEVEADVRNQLLRSLPPTGTVKGSDPLQWGTANIHPLAATLYCYEEESGKFKFSLLQVLLEQISAMGIPLSNVEMDLEDTKTNEIYFSARRDREKAGRQISWIARTEAE